MKKKKKKNRRRRIIIIGIRTKGEEEEVVLKNKKTRDEKVEDLRNFSLAVVERYFLVKDSKIGTFLIFFKLRYYPNFTSPK